MSNCSTMISWKLAGLGRLPLSPLWAHRGRDQPIALSAQECLWLIGSFAQLHGRAFDPQLLTTQLMGPVPERQLLSLMSDLGLVIERLDADRRGNASVVALRPGDTLLALCAPPATDPDHPSVLPGIVQPLLLQESKTAAGDVGGPILQLNLYGEHAPVRCRWVDLVERTRGRCWRVSAPRCQPVDPDTPPAATHFGWRWIGKAAWRQRRVWRDILAASLVLQILGLVTPMLAQVVIDKVVVHGATSTWWAVGILLLGVAVFQALLGWSRQGLLLMAGARIDAELGNSVWQQVSRLPLQFLLRRPLGVIAARMQAVEPLREFISGASVSLVVDTPFMLVALAMMFWYSPPLAALVLLSTLLLATMGALAARPLRQRNLAVFQAGARNQAFVTERLGAIETVKCLQMEPLLDQQYRDQLDGYLRAALGSRQLANTLQSAASLIEQWTSAAILMGGAWIVMHQPGFTVGMLVAFQLMANRFQQPVSRLVGLWAEFQQIRVSVDRLGELMAVPAEVSELMPRRPPSSGGPAELAVKDMAFRHDEGSRWLFKQWNLHVAAGQIILLSGSSGSGKSTLIHLLLGLARPSEGQILLDGIDLRHVPVNQWRQAFAVVPQDAVLFAGTVLDNLQMGAPHARFEDITVAAQLAGIHTAIEQLPQGYQTRLGERGTGLSGGQRQRLAIARALLRRPRLLILDESTSALDAAAAAEVAATLNALKGQVTILFVAHQVPVGLKPDGVVRLNPDGRGSSNAGD